jgi:hypothetical protein
MRARKFCWRINPPATGFGTSKTVLDLIRPVTQDQLGLYGHSWFTTPPGCRSRRPSPAHRRRSLARRAPYERRPAASTGRMRCAA